MRTRAAVSLLALVAVHKSIVVTTKGFTTGAVVLKLFAGLAKG